METTILPAIKTIVNQNTYPIELYTFRNLARKRKLGLKEFRKKLNQCYDELVQWNGIFEIREMTMVMENNYYLNKKFSKALKRVDFNSADSQHLTHLEEINSKCQYEYAHFLQAVDSLRYEISY